MERIHAPPTLLTGSTRLDRPGWIPPEITRDWDPNPYAYQTEEELMAAGGLHGQLLGYIVELLRHRLETRGLMLLIDTFLLYRDAQGVKQRIAPDILLMPLRFPPPSAYDLDGEPPPSLVVEVTSPKSHLTDLEDKVGFYLGFGIPAYLVIDAITPNHRLRRQIQLHLWRLRNGQNLAIVADDGGFTLPEMGVRLLAEGQRLRFRDLASGEVALDMGELLAALETERQARLHAEAEAADLRAELKKLRGEL